MKTGGKKIKKILLITLTIIFLSSAVIAQGEELAIICELKEVLNFKSPTHVMFLRVDMENHTVNGLPSTILGKDIIIFETKSESLTIVLPSMYITVERKGQGVAGPNINYTGVCHEDKLNF